ncbi:MAG TPA: cell division protein ZapB [Bryobacteraceae bacterium]|nr:cell division protein ZapB [Bryobacteraceae bacterium]
METAVQTALPEDEALASLEERIRRAVDLVTSLRAERDAALAEADTARKAAGAAMAETQRLRQELEGLRTERKQVRTRIEKLLGQMDLLQQTT